MHAKFPPGRQILTLSVTKELFDVVENIAAQNFAVTAAGQPLTPVQAVEMARIYRAEGKSGADAYLKSLSFNLPNNTRSSVLRYLVELGLEVHNRRFSFPLDATTPIPPIPPISPVSPALPFNVSNLPRRKRNS